MPCPPDAVLARFAEGTLSADDSAEVETHIDTCSSCRQTISASVRRVVPAATVGKVGRYELGAPLGAGAMGVVYAAFDPELDRRIAVKLLAPDLDTRLAVRQERLAREARSLAKISHPNVVPVHDVGIADGRLFVAMELVDGATLRAHALDRAPPARVRLDLVLQAGRGLAAAHAAGVVHRDFKPDNVFVGADGRVRVGDFGLAAVETGEGEPARDDVRVTQSGALLGTPAYMAPEQLAGEPATPASDQFAFAVTAWEIVFGTRPFRGGTVAELAEAVRQAPADPPGGDRRIAAVLRRGLAHDPARRYRDLPALLADLEAAGQRRRTGPFAAGLAVVVLGSAGALVLHGRDGDDPCAQVDTAVHEIWTPAARVQITGAFLATRSRIAAGAAELASQDLDRWAERWSTAVRGACRDRRNGLVADDAYAQRVRCLDARADELGALVAVLSRADATTVENAVRAVEGLGSVDGCARPHPVASIPPERRADDDRARKLVAEASAQRTSGHYKDAAATLAKIPADLPDPALLSLAARNLGIIESSLGQLASARDHLSRAVVKADEARDDHLRAEALIELLAIVGDEAADLAEAARLQDQARAAVERAGGDPALRGGLAAAIGDIAIRRGKYDEALKSLDEAIASRRAQRPVPEIELADVLNSAAGLRGELGDYAGALAQLDEARALAEHVVGADHPLVATIVATSVQSLYLSGKKPEAIAAGRRALAIFEAAFGPRHPRVAAAANNLAVVLLMEHRFDEGIALLERARAITEAALGPEHVDVGEAWLNIAAANKDAGHFDAAAAAYERALAIWEKALGKDHIDVARALIGYADVELSRGAPDRAVALAERGVAIRLAAHGNPDHVARAQFLLARALRAAGRDAARAVQLATAARDHYAKTDAKDDAAEITSWLEAGHRPAR